MYTYNTLPSKKIIKNDEKSVSLGQDSNMETLDQRTVVLLTEL